MGSRRSRFLRTRQRWQWDTSQGISLWNVEKREVVHTLTGHKNGAGSVAFSSDGTLLVSGGGTNDRTVKLWDVAKRELIATLEGHTGDVTSVAFSQDGHLLASGGGMFDKTVKLWDVAKRELIATLEGHTGDGGLRWRFHPMARWFRLQRRVSR